MLQHRAGTIPLGGDDNQIPHPCVSLYKIAPLTPDGLGILPK
jgi:hypothetical protein